MTPRPLALALTLASLSTACTSDGLECPATGAPLIASVPELQPEWGTGCIDDDAWTAEIQPANATWTVELRRESNGNGMEVRRMLDGVAVVWGGTELIVVDSTGNELASRGLGTFVDWSTFVVTDDGRMAVGDQAGGVPQYRVLSPAGVDIWLRLLDVNPAVGGVPALSLAADGSLWVGVNQFSPDLGDFVLEVQEWGLTGPMKSKVTLPSVSGQAFARDGAGRLAVLGNDIELFSPDGTPIADVEIAAGYAIQIVGLDEGFVFGGRRSDKPFVMRVDGQGQVVWDRVVDGGRSNGDSSFIASLAALPDGGVVAVGGEGSIELSWPDSPITEYQQPFVIALDDAGKPTWGERLAVGGQAWSVAVGSAGEVYVGGSAQGSLPTEYGSTETIGWLRRYDP